MTIRFLTYTLLLISFYFTGCKEPKASASETETTESRRPNIIFIMDDQHRWDALGLVDSVIKTPTLDSLAKNGIFFREAVCQAPMCVPSRNSIMFGLYPNQTGVFRNSGGVADSLLPGKTMAQYFKEAGYETAGFGKTHWGKYKTDTRGFETRYTSEIPEKGGKSMEELNPEAKARYDAEVAAMGPGEENNLGYLGFTSKLPESEHRDGWITDRALEYIEKREDERPLFFYLSYMKPHAGHNVPEGYENLYNLDEITYAEQPPWDEDYSPHAAGVNRRDLYEEYWKNASAEEWKLMTMRYYANVTWIDDMMGRTLRALQEKGLLDNAIVVYTSDHGEMLGEHYYRFNKYNLYESSVRIPLILAGNSLPEDVQKGSVSKRPIENVDILPTLLELAGIPQNKPLPGSNLLKDANKPASFSALHERNGEAAFMWRTENHKLILVLERKDKTSEYSQDAIITGEFYDLAEDPQEWNDLYGKASVTELQKRYTDQLIAFLQQMKP